MTRAPSLPAVLMLAVMLAIAPVHSFAQELHVSGVSVEVADNHSEIVKFPTSAPVTPKKSFTLANPDRVVIDLPHAAGEKVTLPTQYSGKLIKNIRFGQFDPTTSRIVLDMNVPVTIANVTAGSPLAIELAPAAPLPEAAAPAAKSEKEEKAEAPVPPATKGKAEPEDMKPLIVIDAGHGGQDPGAMGVHNTQERDVTLNFAQNLRKALLKTGRYRVALTREDNRFIMLHERVNIARKAKADMLISLHADSNPRPEARGLSIYTLSATASDAEAAALAERENKSDIISGIDLNTTDADVANILIDLTQRETMNKSLTLADAIVANLHPKITRLPQTHRFAGFRVLKSPDVPSVLIELGFLSNATDERLLLSPEYRDVVLASVIKGIDRYYAGQ